MHLLVHLRMCGPVTNSAESFATCVPSAGAPWLHALLQSVDTKSLLAGGGVAKQYATAIVRHTQQQHALRTSLETETTLNAVPQVDASGNYAGIDQSED